MKKAIRYLLLAIPFFLLLSACNSTSDPAHYISRIKEDKQLNKTVTIGKIAYTFHLMTPEGMALRAAAGDGHLLDKKLYNERLNDYKGHVFVNIDMELADRSGPVLRYGLQDQAEYDQRVMYYEFYAKSDLKLDGGGESAPPESYVYENRQGLSPFNTMVIAFPTIKDADHLQVTFNDRAFNNLFVKADFKQSDINNLPRLTLN
jgi:hypothetical protein